MTPFCDITQIEIEKLFGAKIYFYFLRNDTYHLEFFLNKNTTTWVSLLLFF